MYDFKQLSEIHKMYVLELSNKNKYTVSGATKSNIMQSKSQFMELAGGDVINKSFVVDIRFDIEKTKEHLKEIPLEERRGILDNIRTEETKVLDRYEISGHGYELQGFRL